MSCMHMKQNLAEELKPKKIKAITTETSKYVYVRLCRNFAFS